MTQRQSTVWFHRRTERANDHAEHHGGRRARRNSRLGGVEAAVAGDSWDVDDSPSVGSVAHGYLHDARTQPLQWLGNVRLTASRGDRQSRVHAIPDGQREGLIRPFALTEPTDQPYLVVVYPGRRVVNNDHIGQLAPILDAPLVSWSDSARRSSPVSFIASLSKSCMRSLSGGDADSGSRSAFRHSSILPQVRQVTPGRWRIVGCPAVAEQW